MIAEDCDVLIKDFEAMVFIQGNVSSELPTGFTPESLYNDSDVLDFCTIILEDRSFKAPTYTPDFEPTWKDLTNDFMEILDDCEYLVKDYASLTSPANSSSASSSDRKPEISDTLGIAHEFCLPIVEGFHHGITVVPNISVPIHTAIQLPPKPTSALPSHVTISAREAAARQTSSQLLE